MKSKIFASTRFLTGLAVLLTAILFMSLDASAIIVRSITPAGLIKHREQTIQHQRTLAETFVGAAEEPESKVVPSIIFKDGSGKTIDISKQQGKVLFINFWATWCLPCRAEMPSINKLKTEMKGMDILFLMVDVDNNYEKARKFMDRKKYDLPVYTPAGDIPPAFLSRSIPATVIVDKQGRVVGRHEGPGNYNRPEVIKFFKELASK